MAVRYTFEQALAILEIDASAGPRNAKRALMLQLQRHGPEPSPEDFARFNGAYEVLKNPAVWPDYKAPDAWDEDLAPRPQRRLPPGHTKSIRERPAPPPAPMPPTPPPKRGPQGGAQGMREDPFAGLDVPPPNKPRGASKPKPSNPLSENQEVIAALTRLEKNYDSVLPKELMLEHMAAEGTHEMVAFLTQLLESGEFLATGAAVATLLDLMNGDDTLEFVNSRGVVSIMTGVFAQADVEPKAISVGASIQRAYDRWTAAFELNPPSLDIGTRDNLRMTRSLAALPEEFPPELIAATASAIKRGDLQGVRAEFATWIEAYDEQADGLKRIMARSAPALLKVVQDLFPERGGERQTSSWDTAKLKRIALPALAAALIAIVGWFVTQDDAFESAERKALLDAGRALCDYAGNDHATCSLGRIVLDALPASQCRIIEPVIPQFVSAVRSMKNNTGGMSAAVDLGALNKVKAQADKIVIAAQIKCPGI